MFVYYVTMTTTIIRLLNRKKPRNGPMSGKGSMAINRKKITESQNRNTSKVRTFVLLWGC